MTTLDELIELKNTMPKPRKICLCGSTRFYDAFRAWNLRLTLEGYIVLSIGIDTKSDRDLSEAGHALNKKALDILHYFKLDDSDVALFLNVDDYLGESSLRELAYAQRIGLPVFFLEPTRHAQNYSLVSALFAADHCITGYTPLFRERTTKAWQITAIVDSAMCSARL